MMTGWTTPTMADEERYSKAIAALGLGTVYRGQFLSSDSAGRAELLAELESRVAKAI